LVAPASAAVKTIEGIFIFFLFFLSITVWIRLYVYVGIVIGV